MYTGIIPTSPTTQFLLLKPGVPLVVDKDGLDEIMEIIDVFPLLERGATAARLDTGRYMIRIYEDEPPLVKGDAAKEFEVTLNQLYEYASRAWNAVKRLFTRERNND